MTAILINRGQVMAAYLENLGRKDSYKAKYEALVQAVDEAVAVDASPNIHAYWMDGAYCSNCRASKPKPCAAYLEPKANTRCHVCGAFMNAKEANT